MKIITKMEVLLILVVLLYGADALSFPSQDCTRLINTDTLDKCCQKPESNKTMFDSPCDDIEPFINNQPNPCLSYCVFDTWKILDGHRLVMRNLYDMLLYFNDRNEVYVNALRMSYYKCQSIGEQYFTIIESNLMNLHSTCSALPLFYVKCAEMHLFVKCPNQFWSNSIECRDTRSVLQSCMSMLPGVKKRGGPSDLRSSGTQLTPLETMSYTLQLSLVGKALQSVYIFMNPSIEL